MLTTVNHPDPPPPIAQILKLTLHRSVHFALYGSSPTNTSLTSTSTAASAPSSSEAADAGAAAATAYSAKLQPVIDALTQLTPSPSLEPAWKTLTAAGAKVILVTNGAEAATRKYATMGGVDGYISEIISCDAVGKGKPDKKVYDAAHRAADRIGAGEGKEGRWFVACHTWDVAAARKNGYVDDSMQSCQGEVGKPDVVWC
jgi:2-haloacid dehalogenase